MAVLPITLEESAILRNRKRQYEGREMIEGDERGNMVSNCIPLMDCRYSPQCDTKLLDMFHI